MNNSIETTFADYQELSNLFQETYEQLVDLKHIIYSSTDLTKLESIAVKLSWHIKEKMGGKSNAVWLVVGDDNVIEVVRDCRILDEKSRKILKIDSSEILKHVIHKQLVVWPGTFMPEKDRFPGFESATIFPIKGKSEASGFFIVDQVDRNKIEIGQFLSQFTGMIFNVSRLYTEVLEQKSELEEITQILLTQNSQMATLHHVGIRIATCVNSGEICRIVTETAVKELGIKKAAAFIMKGEPPVLAGVAQCGGIHDIETLALSTESLKAAEKCVERQRIVTCRDFSPDFEMGPNTLKNWFIVPIKGRDRSIGVIVVETDDMDLTDSMAILVNHASIVLENTMLSEKRKMLNELLASKSEELRIINESLEKANKDLQILTVTDSLTGLGNHRFFQDRLDAEFSRVQRYNGFLSLIMMDLDHFKAVNDTYGHSVGDMVLKEISTRIKERLRGSDIITRYGGEEFAAILPETDMESAIKAAEKLRLAVCGQPVSISSEMTVSISISAGVSTFPSPHIHSREELFTAADKALYRAKEAGRNRVEAFDSPTF